MTGTSLIAGAIYGRCQPTRCVHFHVSLRSSQSRTWLVEIVAVCALVHPLRRSACSTTHIQADQVDGLQWRITGQWRQQAVSSQPLQTWHAHYRPLVTGHRPVAKGGQWGPCPPLNPSAPLEQNILHLRNCKKGKFSCKRVKFCLCQLTALMIQRKSRKISS